VLISPQILAGTRKTAVVAAGGGDTFDPLNFGTHIILSNGNLTATGDAVNWSSVLTVGFKTTGKAYAEFLVTVVADPSGTQLGIANNNQNVNTFLGAAGDAAFTKFDDSGAAASGKFTANGANLPTYSATTGDVLALAIDFDAGKGWAAYNNTFGGSPAAGTNPFITWTADASNIFIAFGDAAGNAATLRPTSGSQSFSPPAGFTAWG
jgi:hypothetical protein